MCCGRRAHVSTTFLPQCAPSAVLRASHSLNGELLRRVAAYRCAQRGVAMADDE